MRAGEKEIYVYNKNGDLIRTHQRNYTPKSWVVIPSDMPAEYGDYGYWSVPYFQHKSSWIGPNTQTLILGMVKKFNHPVQSFRSCFGILKLADRYSPQALGDRCRAAVIFGKFNYTYIANTIATYYTDVPGQSKAPIKKPQTVLPTTGTYKDDDARYTLRNLMKRQEEEGF